VHAAAAEVTEALEDFDSLRAGRRLTQCIDDLSNWYVRSSRRRFWDGDPAALGTLHECLQVITLLMAPFTPFVTEQVWDGLFAGQGELPDSVHLARWPQADGSLVDAELAAQVALVRRLVDLGRQARAESKVRTRQPLGRAMVSAQGWQALPADLRALVSAELNVVTLEPLAGDLVDVSAKANFRALGKRFGKGVQAVASAVAAADAAELAAGLRDGTASVLVDGEPVALSPDEVVVTETPRTGWAVASAAGETVALDLEITPELRRAGLVREAVRLVQDARKTSGLEVSDRIELWWQADGELAQALTEGSGRLGEEVLAVSVGRAPRRRGAAARGRRRGPALLAAGRRRLSRGAPLGVRGGWDQWDARRLVPVCSVRPRYTWGGRSPERPRQSGSGAADGPGDTRRCSDRSSPRRPRSSRGPVRRPRRQARPPVLPPDPSGRPVARAAGAALDRPAGPGGPRPAGRGRAVGRRAGRLLQRGPAGVQVWSGPWDGLLGRHGSSEHLGSVDWSYDTPTRHWITIYRVLVTAKGAAAGQSPQSLLDGVLALAGGPGAVGRAAPCPYRPRATRSARCAATRRSEAPPHLG
jgi:hypothetical protein